MGSEPRANVVEERKIEAGIGNLKTERVFPIEAAPHRIRRLAIGKAFHIVHDEHEGEPPRRDLDRSSLVRIEIREQVIVEECAELSAEINVDIAFWESSGNGGRRHGRDRWERLAA